MKLALITELFDSSKKGDPDKKKGATAASTGANDMAQWVSTEQAAEIVGVSTGRIRQFVQDGRLTSHQPTDSDHYFKRADVVQLAKEPRERTGRPDEGKGTSTKDDKKIDGKDDKKEKSDDK